jgi:hypothetical protein
LQIGLFHLGYGGGVRTARWRIVMHSPNFRSSLSTRDAGRTASYTHRSFRLEH